MHRCYHIPQQAPIAYPRFSLGVDNATLSTNQTGIGHDRASGGKERTGRETKEPRSNRRNGPQIADTSTVVNDLLPSTADGTGGLHTTSANASCHVSH